jgi:hypothetical protein
LLVGSEDSELGDLVGGGSQPGGSGFFKPGVEDMPVSALNHP